MPNTATIYINLEDDVTKITERLKREKAAEITLVCPKRCFLFNDSINLRLLKKQSELLQKDISILTMDERGQVYAKEAGFKLKFLPKVQKNPSFSDIRVAGKKEAVAAEPAPKAEKENSLLDQAAQGLKAAVKNIAAPVISTASIITAKPEITETPTPAEKTEPEEEPVREFPKEFGEKLKTSNFGSHHNTLFTSLVILSLLVILGVAFLVLPKAEVIVYGRSEPITRDLENVGLSINIDEPNVGKLHLPATRLVETYEKTQEFQSQGKKEMGYQASGTVRIYNFTQTPISLRASTTVLSIGNKEYVLVKDVNYYKPTSYTNAQTKEVNQKSLGDPVEVVARQGGESYNAPAGTRMEIDNKVFGSKPLLLYAVVESPLANGTSRFLSYVDEKDLGAAQAALGESILKDVRSKLAPRDLVLLDKAFSLETVNFSTDKPVGTETPNFNATMKVKFTGLAFKKTELEQLIADRISQTVSSNSTLKMSDSQMTYAMTGVDLASGVGTMQVHFEGKAVPNVSLENIEHQLTGKTKDEASDIIKQKADVEKIEMTLSPTWQKNFPWFASKINVKVVE